MISSNFAVAVVTVVLRGLFDRIVWVVQAPIVRSPFIPRSTSLLLVGGTLYLLYNKLVKGQRIQMSCSSENKRRPKILDGRLHKNGSQSSSGSHITEHRAWLPRFRSHRPRSRCRGNLLQATKDSLEMLHRERSSSNSLTSKSASCVKCGMCKDSSVPRTKEGSPSVYSVKSGDGDAVEKIEDKTHLENMERFNGLGDCDWEERHPKTVKRRKKTRITHKTRSGKMYYSYV